MNMIIGGAFQGKYAYAKKMFPNLAFLDGALATEEELLSCQGINHFDAFIRREIQEGRSTDHLAERIIEHNPKIIVICNEVGYGIVPMEKLDRESREATGRVCTELAAFSEQVTRVVCGIGTVIKG